MKSNLFPFRTLLLAAFLGGLAVLPGSAMNKSQVWGSKPVLGFLVDTPVLAAHLQADLGLNEAQFQTFKRAAAWEQAQIERIQTESDAIVADPQLSRAQKARWVAESGYNRKILAVLAQSQARLERELGRKGTRRLVEWIGTHWNTEQPQAAKVRSSLRDNWQKSYPRSFEVYATRYDAGDRKIVALPDKCLKFANGGALKCEGGYEFGQAYSVAISYQGNMVVALVGESGPWNVDDNYWAKYNDPQPRRMFADLPLGVPEAQAAYFDGYNGGVDQFGRLVTSPVAIDISRALAADLGLPSGNNKVTVSFLWTEGWDSSPKNTAPGNSDPPPAPAGITWEKATPNPDGSIIHIVKTGQTLIGISTIYEIPLAELLTQNGLNQDAIIQPGDPVRIKPPDPTATPTLTPTSTPRPTGTATALPTATATQPPAPTATTTPTLPQPGWLQSNSLLLVFIAAVAVIGIGLLAWGLGVQRGYKNK